ncbi:hypothetical protein LTR46_011950, partial [Exophiala xenobiotica]
MATNNVNGSADTHPFSINNIPYGVAKTATSATPGIVTRYHDHVYFISDLIHGGFLKEAGEEGEHALAQVRDVSYVNFPGWGVVDLCRTTADPQRVRGVVQGDPKTSE